MFKTRFRDASMPDKDMYFFVGNSLGVLGKLEKRHGNVASADNTFW